LKGKQAVGGKHGVKGKGRPKPVTPTNKGWVCPYEKWGGRLSSGSCKWGERFNWKEREGVGPYN